MLEHLFTHRHWNIRVVRYSACTGCFIREYDEAPVYLLCVDPMQARRKAVAYINKVTENEYLGRFSGQKVIPITVSLHKRGDYRGRPK